MSLVIILSSIIMTITDSSFKNIIDVLVLPVLTGNHLLIKNHDKIIYIDEYILVSILRNILFIEKVINSACWYFLGICLCAYFKKKNWHKFMINHFDNFCVSWWLSFSSGKTFLKQWVASNIDIYLQIAFCSFYYM